MAPHTSNRDKDKIEVPKEIMNKPLPIRYIPKELEKTSVQRNIILKKVVIYAIPASGKYRKYKERIRLHWVTAFEVEVKQEEPARYIVVDTKVFLAHFKKYNTMALPMEINIQEQCYKYHKDSHKESLQELKFECSLKPIAFRKVYDLMIAKKLPNYRARQDGNGCFYWTKKFFNAMFEEDKKAMINKEKEKEWFESEEDAKRVKEKLNSFKEDHLIGETYIIPGGKGQFFVADDEDQ